MKIYDAIKELEDKSMIIVDTFGNKFQRISTTQIMQTWNRNLLSKDDNSIGSSISNERFLEKYLHSEFNIEIQWYQNKIKFPIFCKVKEQGWSNYKIVCFNSKSGYWFQTHFGESYLPTYDTHILPFSDEEIENMKRGF